MGRYARFSALIGSLLVAGCGGNMAEFMSTSSSVTTSTHETATLRDNREDSSRESPDDERLIGQVMELRKAIRQNPTDAELKLKLHAQEERAGSQFLASGNALLAKGQFNEAIQQYELGLVAQPGSGQIQEARTSALRRKEVSRLYSEEQKAKAVGNFDLAQSLLEKADSLDKGNSSLRVEIKDIEKRRSTDNARYVVAAFAEASPIAVNFRSARLKEALTGVSQPYNLNFVFDQDTEELGVSVSARNVTFRQAFQMILQASNTAYKVIGPNSVLIYTNTPEKRAKYADLYFKTFHLYNVKAERMAEILKSSMELKTMVANNELNTLQIRDSQEALEVIERVIGANDRAPAEVMLDVEILEINRSKAEQLGVDYGSQMTWTFPGSVTSSSGSGASATTTTSTSSGLPARAFVNGQFLKAVLGESHVTLPSVTLKYLRNDVDAKVLAKPRVRTMDGKPAKIHIGDRVPLRSSTVQDVTGQSRTMYEYRDIGIKLDVLPKYHLDDTITVELNMEVSALGANLGTTAEPAYAIGTRNVNTTMLLREGETALLGGLIRDDERRTLNKVPGLGDAGGIVGRLFSNHDDSDQRTDVLLTITPKVIRDQALPRHKDSSFYSGGPGNYTTQATYDYLKKVPSESEPPQYKLSPESKGGGMQNAKNSAPANKASPNTTWHPANNVVGRQ